MQKSELVLFINFHLKYVNEEDSLIERAALILLPYLRIEVRQWRVFSLLSIKWTRIRLTIALCWKPVFLIPFIKLRTLSLNECNDLTTWSNSRPLKR